jgi:DNA-binding CsgD family transcriptional regulator/tetratricopeptide (TPR) repeat protein
VPFRPLSEALHSVLRQAPPQDAWLQPYWPVLARFDPGLPGYEAAAPAEQSLVLRAEALLRLLSALGRTSGCILLLEDLHDADAETLAVVDYLVDNLASTPVLFLATLRPNPGPAFDTMTAATMRRVARALPLGRLSVAETVDLAADRLGTEAARVPAEVVSRLTRDADGVPFVIEELLSAMVEGGRLVSRGGEWTVDRTVVTEVPATVTAAILQRTTRLDGRCVALLEAAAVLGRRFPAPVAAAVAGVAADEVFALLRTAVSSEFIVPDPSGSPDWYAFRHALTGEAILHRLLPGERARLSRRAAEAVAAGAEHVGDDWPQLAAGLWLAGNEPRRAADFFSRAGRRATHRGALATAVELFERGLRPLEGATAAPAEEVVDLLDGLVRALTLTGDSDRALQCSDRLVAVLSALDATAERRAEAHLLRARAADTGGRREFGLAEVAAARALISLDAEPRLAAPLDAVAARLVLGGRSHDRLVSAAALARRALGAADAQPEVACEALEVLGRCTRQTDLGAAEEHFAHALRIAERHALTVWRIRAMMELGVIDKLRFSDPVRLMQAREAALAAGALVTVCLADLQLSTVHLVRAEYEEATACSERVIDMATRLRLPQLRVLATGSLAGIAGAQGRRAEMERALAVCEAEGAKFGYGNEVLACAGGICSLLTEHRDRAVAEFASAEAEDLAVATLRASGYRGPYLLVGTVEGTSGWAEYEEFAGSQFAQVNWNQPFLAATRAVLLGRDGQRDAAVEAMREAVDVAERLPMGLALVRRLVAEAALADGWGEPIGWLRAAEEFFHGNDLPRAAAACRSLLRQAGAPPRQRRAGSSAIPDELRRAGVTVREHEVLMLLADRLGNQAIAERLFLSPRTVEKHVASLLSRTNQADRAALVRLARRHSGDRVPV